MVGFFRAGRVKIAGNKKAPFRGLWAALLALRAPDPLPPDAAHDRAPFRRCEPAPPSRGRAGLLDLDGLAAVWAVH